MPNLARVKCALFTAEPDPCCDCFWRSFAPLRQPDRRADELRVLAAGSLREAIGEIGDRYRKATGIAVAADFSSSGLLRERIETGEKTDLFASADMGNPLKLLADGRAVRVDMFTRNTLCAFAAPKVGLTNANFIDRLLDPA